MPRIFDAVYDYIELDDVEFKLVNSPIFQRLHWIKQLGPLHTVFPSAQHSRFSHTIGVFYIVKKMINHLDNMFQKDGKDGTGYEFVGKDKEILRFAALLHDIGHVPLSHTGEIALKDIDKKDFLQEMSSKDKSTKGIDIPSKAEEPSWWRLFPEPEYRGGSTKLHERLSAEIVLHNEEIDKILSEVPGWKTKTPRTKAKKKIAQIIVGQDETDIPTLLLHSELDADRLDYLLRDSFFAGVGYGHIDLDYIISRLVIFRDEFDTANLCIENKGLHTVEHYILGRFFLQTQVVYNRKVRLMDLLFADVMRYMLGDCPYPDEKLINLKKLRDHIRASKGKNRREHLHKIYSFTDAQVFTKMRGLHVKFDLKEASNTASENELYINDCIKIIMDGDIPDPCFPTCQKQIDLTKKIGFSKMLQDKADKISTEVAKKLGVHKKRIKANVVEQEVMKFKRRMDVNGEENEEANMEAVKIIYEKPEGKKEFIPAAKSNATILGGLTDKALVIFNVFYVPLKRTDGLEEIKSKKKIIRGAYGEFVSTYFQTSQKQSN